jgi:hypothetical protein
MGPVYPFRAPPQAIVPVPEKSTQIEGLLDLDQGNPGQFVLTNAPEIKVLGVKGLGKLPR